MSGHLTPSKDTQYTDMTPAGLLRNFEQVYQLWGKARLDKKPMKNEQNESQASQFHPAGKPKNVTCSATRNDPHHRTKLLHHRRPSPLDLIIAVGDENNHDCRIPTKDSGVSAELRYFMWAITAAPEGLTHVNIVFMCARSDGLTRKIETSHARITAKMIRNSLRFLLRMEERVAIGTTTRPHTNEPTMICSVALTACSE